MKEFNKNMDELNNSQNYAGFLLRFMAYVIDSAIISLGQLFIISPLMNIFGVRIPKSADFFDLSEAEIQALIPTIVDALGIVWAATFILSWLYYAFMQSSSYQATLGKLALGLKVVDLNGEKISFSKATVRFMSKIISSIILFIGFIMAGFTEKKQALHDIIGGTLVIRKEQNYTQE